MQSIDLNADLGEKVGGPGHDEALLDVVTSASIACGFHAGDPTTMRRTLEAAISRGVAVGAHPSYPDREGFGRSEQHLAPGQIADDVTYQIGALDGLARAHGARVNYVKPHGAMYNRMATDVECAKAISLAVRAYGGLVLLAPAGTPSVDVARRLGIEVATEVFADRAYLPDGRLAPRDHPGALVTDPAEAVRRAMSLARDHRVTTVDGGSIELEGSSMCVHGDTPGALEIAKQVHAALREAGVAVAPFVS